MRYLADLLLYFAGNPIAEVVFWTWYFGLLFSSYAAFHRARVDGTLRPAHWFVAFPVLLQGWPVDILWNSTLGAACFGEWPWQNWDWSFTARIGLHLRDLDWRGTEAKWWKTMLNALDPGHL